MDDLYERARECLAFGAPWRSAWGPYDMRRYVAPAIRGARLSPAEASGLVGAVSAGYEKEMLLSALYEPSVQPNPRGLRAIVDEFESRRRRVGAHLLREAFGDAGEANPDMALADAMDGCEACWRRGLLLPGDAPLVASYVAGDGHMDKPRMEYVLATMDGLSAAFGRGVRQAIADGVEPDPEGMAGLARWTEVLQIPTRERRDAGGGGN